MVFWLYHASPDTVIMRLLFLASPHIVSLYKTRALWGFYSRIVPFISIVCIEQSAEVLHTWKDSPVAHVQDDFTALLSEDMLFSGRQLFLIWDCQGCGICSLKKNHARCLRCASYFTWQFFCSSPPPPVSMWVAEDWEGLHMLNWISEIPRGPSDNMSWSMTRTATWGNLLKLWIPLCRQMCLPLAHLDTSQITWILTHS